MRFGLSQCFPAGRPGGELKGTVSFLHDGRRYESDPVVVK